VPETTEIKSIDALLDTIERIAHQTPVPLWYRGQRDASWGVQPSLWRPGQHGRYTLADERNFTHRFRTRATIRYPGFPRYDDHAGWLSLMQHYGLPTRLLDWSRSPLIAAYFALEAYLDTRETLRATDAAIWVLAPHRLNQIYADTTVTPALSSGVCSQLVRQAFLNDSLEAHARSATVVIAAMATETDLRMFVQQGCFTVHSPDVPSLEADSFSEDFLWRLLIPRELVHRFARQVDRLGFRNGDLFPDLEHLADELKRFYPPGSVEGMKF
jgi:hypothetical protein